MILIPQYRTARRAAGGLDLLSNLILSLDMEEASGDALDSSGNGYTFTDQNSVGQMAGATAGYSARSFDASLDTFFNRSGSDLAIGDSEWAIHLWAYHDTGTSDNVLFSKAGPTSITTSTLQSFSLYKNGSSLVTFKTGLDPAASGSAFVVSAPLSFARTTWTPILAWHDPDADEIGLKVGSDSPVTASITTGVRDAPTIPYTIGRGNSLNDLTGGIAALRIWRGPGVINQIVNNTDAIDFLNAQQRRHSEL